MVLLTLIFMQDKLMTVPTDASSGGSSGNWLFKNKEHGKTSAAASLVCIRLPSGLCKWLFFITAFKILYHSVCRA